jgi:hypothetical protein
MLSMVIKRRELSCWKLERHGSGEMSPRQRKRPFPSLPFPPPLLCSPLLSPVPLLIALRAQLRAHPGQLITTVTPLLRTPCTSPSTGGHRSMASMHHRLSNCDMIVR